MIVINDYCCYRIINCGYRSLPPHGLHSLKSELLETHVQYLLLARIGALRPQHDQLLRAARSRPRARARGAVRALRRAAPGEQRVRPAERGHLPRATVRRRGHRAPPAATAQTAETAAAAPEEERRHSCCCCSSYWWRLRWRCR